MTKRSECYSNFFFIYERKSSRFVEMKKILTIIFLIVSFNSFAGYWTQKANFPGKRTATFSFSIDQKGYVGCGWDSTGLHKDFWEYDPATNLWTQKADFG